MTKNRLATFAVLSTVILALASLTSCGNLFQTVQTESGVTISIASSDVKSLVPDKPIVVASYLITCVRTGKATITKALSASATTSGPIYLEPGEWEITVLAKNDKDKDNQPIAEYDVGKGTVIATVNAGDITPLTIKVAPLTGNGTLLLTLDYVAIFDAFASFSGSPLVKGVLTPIVAPTSGPASYPFEITINASSTDRTVSYSSDGDYAGIPAGYYSLALELYDKPGTGDPVFRAHAAPESVRIAEGLTTTGTVTFSMAGSGFNVLVTTDLQTPIDIAFTGVPSGESPKISQNATMTVGARLSEAVVSWAWYLDGLPYKTSRSIVVGPNLLVGHHRIDLFVKTATKAASKSFAFDVDPYTAPPVLVKEGNFTVTNLTLLEALRGTTKIIGNLSLSDSIGNMTDLTPLAALTEVTGNLQISGMLALGNLDDLVSLASVGGALTISSNVILHSARVPSLESVAGTITVDANTILESIEFTGITGGDPSDIPLPAISVSSNPLLNLMDFGADVNHFASTVYIYNNGLASPGGMHLRLGTIKIASASINITGNKIASLDLSSLTGNLSGDYYGPDRSFSITNNQGLKTLGLGSYMSMTPNYNSSYESIQITGNTELTNIDLSGIPAFGHLINISSNPKLVAIDLSKLAVMTYAYPEYGSLTISGNKLLTTINIAKIVNFSSPGSLACNLTITDNPSLLELPYMPLLTNVDGSIVIARNGIRHLAVSGSAGFKVLQNIARDIQIEGNPSLVSAALGLDGSCGLPAGTGTITVRNNDALASLDGLFGPTGINTIGDVNHNLVIEGNDLLSSVASLGTSDILAFYDITLKDNPKLVSLAGMHQLTTVGGTLDIQGVTAFSGLGAFSALNRIGTLQIKNTVGFTQIAAIDLTTLKQLGNLLVQGNQNLTAVNFGGASLMSGGMASIDIRDNPVLASLAFPAGITSASYLTVINNSSSVATSTNLGVLLPSLTTSYTIQIYNNSTLNLISFPNLTSVSYDMLVNDNPELTSLSAPLVSSVGNSIRISTVKKLTELKLQALGSMGGYMNIIDTALSIANFDSFIDTSTALTANYIQVQNNPNLTNQEIETWRTTPGRNIPTGYITGNGGS